MKFGQVQEAKRPKPMPGDPLYLDEHILVINKEAGTLVVPASHKPDDKSLVEILSLQYGKLWPVHRLDRETSGVLLFARDAEAHRILNHQFQMREIHKTYHLLVIGQPEWETKEVNLPLRVNGDRRHRTIIDLAQGKPAQTHFRILQRYHDKAALIEAVPFTGYTHQIRTHASSCGLWILKDWLYLPWFYYPGIPAAKPSLQDEEKRLADQMPIQRVALHALRIIFTHPSTNNQVTIDAPYPQDFRQTIEVLQQ
jgi:RluA family pseudouridine synthase